MRPTTSEPPKVGDQLGGCVAAFVAPPFTGLDTLPSLGVVLLSLAVLLEDILLAIVALAIGVVGVLLTAVSRRRRDQGDQQTVLTTGLEAQSLRDSPTCDGCTPAAQRLDLHRPAARSAWRVLLGDPRLGMPGVFLSLHVVLPHRYPLAHGLYEWSADARSARGLRARSIRGSTLAPTTQARGRKIMGGRSRRDRSPARSAGDGAWWFPWCSWASDRDRRRGVTAPAPPAFRLARNSGPDGVLSSVLR